MKTNPKQRRGFTLVELLVVIVIIASLAGLTAPMVIRQRKKADQTEATSNARQIGLAMFEFESEYQSYPEDSLAGNNTATGEPYLPNAADFTTLTGASNDYFRQLFAAGITESEQMFYAKDGNARKPDGIIDSGNSLAANEVGFGYIMKTGGEGLTSAGNPSRVIAATPALTATTFNEDPFDSKAVVLKIDQSVSSININKDGEALLSGQNLLTGGVGTIWGTTVPTPTMVIPTYD